MHGAKPAANPPKPPADESIPETHGGHSDLYSNKHEKLLLRLDHIDRMDAIRREFNRERLHQAKAPMTTSDLVNACLDLVFEHRIPFHKLDDAGRLPQFIAEHVYRDVLSRWRQWTERF